jgi:RNA polymerase primary sigma factor
MSHKTESSSTADNHETESFGHVDSDSMNHDTESLSHVDFDDKKRRKRAKGRAGNHKEQSVDDDSDTLSRYFAMLSKCPVMPPGAEIEAAQNIEKLEVGYWQALLSYSNVFETIVSVLKGNLNQLRLDAMPDEVRKLGKIANKIKKGDPAEPHRERWDELSCTLSEKLRKCDLDRNVVKEACEAVECLANMYSHERNIEEGDVIRLTPDFKEYLNRVGAANRAQKEAKNDFASANLRLVVSVARRCNRGYLPLIDLIQEGNIGLMKAVERFNPDLGFRFSTYASWWIRHSTTRAIGDRGRTVRIPVHLLESYNKISRFYAKFSSRNGRMPDSEEIYKETGVPADKIATIMSAGKGKMLELNRPIGDSDGATFGDSVEDSKTPGPLENLMTEQRRILIQECMNGAILTPMEIRILKWRFGLDNEDELTLKEIGDKYNLSRERIRQLQEQALSKLRSKISSRLDEI